jgi:hypothetical protein
MKYKIHPIVMGTKVFDKSMMTYQYNAGTEFTIPIYCWYIEGGEYRILVDTGEMSPIRSDAREKAIGGRIYTFEEGLEHIHTPHPLDFRYLEDFIRVEDRMGGGPLKSVELVRCA